MVIGGQAGIPGFKVFFDAEQGKNIAALRHIGNAAFRTLIGCRAGDFLTVKMDRAGRNRVRASNGPHQTGFANTVGAQNAGHLTDVCA